MTLPARDAAAGMPVGKLVLGAVIAAFGATALFMPSEQLHYTHATVAVAFATIWLGVQAWRHSHSISAVAAVTCAPAHCALWMGCRATLGFWWDDMSELSTILGTSYVVLMMGLALLPRIYTSGDMAIDTFSARAAVDGLIVAIACYMPYWFWSRGHEAAVLDHALVAVAVMLGSMSLARLSQDEHRSPSRAVFTLILLTGAMLVVDVVTMFPASVGFAFLSAGLAGQAWSLPVSTPPQPNAQRVFEPDDIWPSVVLLAVTAATTVVWHEKFVTWQALTLICCAAATLTMRLVVGVRAENIVRHQVRTLVYADPLTGIGNRRALLERLQVGPGWVLSLDLDSFKSVNDQFGHEAGDIVLCRFVGRVQKVLPKGAEMFRIGGDEFAIVVSDKVRNIRGLSREVVACGSDPHHSEISVSVGLAPFSAGDNPAGALRGSDIALQEAKAHGKNCAAILDDSMLSERMRDLQIASRLRSGGLDDIFVVYQPLVAMGWPGHPVIGVEALARWNDAELGTISPVEFVPICERQGLIPQLGLTVLRQALEQLRVWMDHGTPIQISINVSVLQLRDEHVVAQMERLLAVEPELAKWIIIEVTETVFSDDDRAVNSLRQLRSLGLCTALDDFGTGASTLTRLRHLPIDILKIDRSLVMGAGTDESADAILDMVATLGRRMDMVLVAEGLEDPLATNRCAELGYAVGQGYVFSRPMPANMLPDLARLQRPAMPRRAQVDRLWTQSAMAVGGRPQVSYDEDHSLHDPTR